MKAFLKMQATTAVAVLEHKKIKRVITAARNERNERWRFIHVQPLSFAPSLNVDFRFCCFFNAYRKSDLLNTLAQLKQTQKRREHRQAQRLAIKHKADYVVL